MKQTAKMTKRRKKAARKSHQNITSILVLVLAGGNLAEVRLAGYGFATKEAPICPSEVKHIVTGFLPKGLKIIFTIDSISTNPTLPSVSTEGQITTRELKLVTVAKGASSPSHSLIWRNDVQRYSFIALFFDSKPSSAQGKFDCVLERVILLEKDWQNFSGSTQDKTHLDDVFKLQGIKSITREVSSGPNKLKLGKQFNLIGEVQLFIIRVGRELEYTSKDFSKRFIDVLYYGIIQKYDAPSNYLSLISTDDFFQMRQAHKRTINPGESRLGFSEVLDRITQDNLPGYKMLAYDPRNSKTIYSKLLLDRYGTFQSGYGLRKSIMVNFLITGLDKMSEGSEFQIRVDVNTVNSAPYKFVYCSPKLKISHKIGDLYKIDISLEINSLMNPKTPPKTFHYEKTLQKTKFLSYGLIISQVMLGYPFDTYEDPVILLGVEHYMHQHGGFYVNNVIQVQSKVGKNSFYDEDSTRKDQHITILLEGVKHQGKEVRENIYGVRLRELRMMNGAYLPYYIRRDFKGMRAPFDIPENPPSCILIGVFSRMCYYALDLHQVGDVPTRYYNNYYDRVRGQNCPKSKCKVCFQNHNCLAPVVGFNKDVIKGAKAHIPHPIYRISDYEKEGIFGDYLREGMFKYTNRNGRVSWLSCPRTCKTLFG